MKKTNNKIKRIGFDLDGVILYNPLRIFRPVVALAKKHILKKDDVKFYVPQKPFMKMFWNLAHRSSLFVTPGFKETMELLKKNNVEAYIITARFSTLQKDFDKWMKKIDAENNFKGYYTNPKNEQPHEFKKRMIKKLDLDLFIDDNWDIVSYLNAELKDSDKKILWITNLFDQFIPYPYKYPDFKSVYKYLQENIQTSE